jgi:hypothetical protein
VIEQLKYVATGTGTLSVTVPTDPITDHPGQSHGDNTETRVRVRVEGLPVSIGRSIHVNAAQDCTNDFGNASSDHAYSFVVSPGQFLVLPAAALKPTKVRLQETDVYCSWAVSVQSPLTGSGVHHVTVEVSALSPLNVAVGQGDFYAAERCTITVATGGNQRSCTSLMPSQITANSAASNPPADQTTATNPESASPPADGTTLSAEAALLAYERGLARGGAAHGTATCKLVQQPGERPYWPTIECEVYSLTSFAGAQTGPAWSGGGRWWILNSVEASPIGNYDCRWTITVGVNGPPGQSKGVLSICDAGWTQALN